MALFVGLLLLGAAERRLSEIHFNLRSAATSLENDDALDRDEIRARLIGVKDEQPPALPRSWTAFSRRATTTSVERPVDRALGVPAPRGPPVSSSTGA
ncbi:MAG: hypothetical protein HYU41_11805 [Candidatus Rokubacteria bacterium]|nr:hypothetical protein [Candidatus Rokubacteria bacterium]